MSAAFSRRPARRVYYLAGPGDVIGTFRRWVADTGCDEREVARTYSWQFFDVIRRHGLTALVEASRAAEPAAAGRGIRVIARPRIGRRWRGPLWELALLLNALRITWTALRFRADTLVIQAGTRWFMLLPAALMGIRVVPDLHNTIWPEGVPPPRRDLADRLNGLFWRTTAQGTVVISPAVRRQVLTLAGAVRGPVLVATPQYDPAQFEAISGPSWRTRPLVVLHAGRLERDKGVFDLLEAACQVERAAPGQVAWELFGDGSARAELERAAAASPVAGRFHVRGHQNQGEMRRAFGRAHMVVVPTRSSFSEGFAKVVAEAMLSGRPVVTSAVVPAAEVVPEAVLLVPPDRPDEYAQAVLRLLTDEALYNRLAEATGPYRARFVTEDLSWGSMLERVLGLVPMPEPAAEQQPSPEMAASPQSG